VERTSGSGTPEGGPVNEPFVNSDETNLGLQNPPLPCSEETGKQKTSASTPGGDSPAAEADDEPWDADGVEPVTVASEEVTASGSLRARNPNAARARGPVAEAT